MDFEVKRADVHECRVADEQPPDLAPGQALLRVDAFALTTNNITYAVMGDALRYWDFFPTRDGDTGDVSRCGATPRSSPPRPTTS